jgi:hypothetical protein
MFTPILLAVAILIIAFVVVVLLRPADFRVEKSATISAPGEIAFAQVNDLHRWAAWSPWEKIDPALKRSYAGPAAGTCTSYAWAGNQKLGEGRMTITESHPSDFIRIKLEFLKPFKATHTAEFRFKTERNQTVVTWSMFGKHNFMGKAMGLVMNCDKMLGSQFEKGLAQLKSTVEAATEHVGLASTGLP